MYCPAGDFYIDPWQPVARAVITHAHGDHARPGSRPICAPSPARHSSRAGSGPSTVIEPQPYGTRITLGDTRVSFHPAGHILGSAQIRIEGPGGVWVVTGDFKRAADPTCAPFEPVRCDTFVTESTFGLPIYRWDPTDVVMREIVDWWDENRDARARRRCCSATRSARRSASGRADALHRSPGARPRHACFR